MTFLYFAILIATLGSAIVRGGDIMSPTRIYISIYSLLLSLYSLKLSQLQTPWSTTTQMLFWGANFMFLASTFIAFMLRKTKAPGWIFDFKSIRLSLKEDAARLNWAWFLRVLIFCVIVFTLSFAVSAFITGGIPALSKDPDDARIKFFSANGLTNYGMFFGPIAMMLGMEMLMLAPLTRQKRRFVLGLVLFIFALYLTMVTRYDIFRFFIFTVVVYHYGRQPLQIKHLVIGMGFIVTIFMAAFLIRFNMDTLDTFNEMVKVKMPPRLSWASSFYAYLANDFWNLDFAIRRFEDGVHSYPVQYGFSVMRGLLFILHLDGGLQTSYGFDTIMNESTIKLKGLNTIIYIWHFYKDFGAAGVYFMTFILGLILSIFYQNTIMRPTAFRISLWALLVPAIALSYHAPLWELWFFYLNIGILMVAHRKIGIL
ncbi:MAG: hypothetical protein JWP91_3425 [Fibrobacteres bacterium]|nr:hypothetical protein [Fibrobacterota bacterium]